MNTPPPKSQRDRQSTPSKPVILPNELITEILSWLPVKYLMQMKCVSKSWNNLISDPKFVQLHLNRSARNPYFSSVVSNHHDDDDNDDDYSFIHFPVNRLLENRYISISNDPYYQLNDKDCCYEVVGSCNGLICLIGYPKNEIVYKTMWLCFWNPATRKISDKLGSDYHYNVKYTWKYSKFVFGYDNSTDTYKVVAVSQTDNNDPQSKTKVRVFSLGDNIWRTIQGFPVVPLQVFIKSMGCDLDGVHLNCTVNWMANQSDLTNDYVIISLDLCTEKYTQMLLPQGLEYDPHVLPSVCVLNDSLCLYRDFKRTDFVIWKMKEFGDDKSWIQFLKFSYNNIRMNYKLGHRPIIKLTPLHLSEDGETLVFANNLQDRAILYNRRTNRLRKTRINNKICWFSIKHYVESLVSTS
ncbi:hypothetical protein TSUD_176010 [Trifolium subterraneum]|uniref:F-box domain-containing protein n=1 Tax=Trifolium subterraneum TaxID=3900 RepID=A0A2Z6LKF9_TRISU|nr:hypothetical protein TSUD_176010 [Trifolium subterraneum]